MRQRMEKLKTAKILMNTEHHSYFFQPQGKNGCRELGKEWEYAFHAFPNLKNIFDLISLTVWMV